MDHDSCSCRIVHPEKVELATELALADQQVEELSMVFKLLADPGRLRIIHALGHQEMCVCDLAAFLAASESAVSHQLRLLRQSGLVHNRRDGNVLYYRLATSGPALILATANDIINSGQNLDKKGL